MDAVCWARAARIVGGMHAPSLGPRTGGYAVVPARLHTARDAHEVAAQALAEVGRSLAGLHVQTGRADTSDACASVLRRLAGALDAAAEGTRRAGAAASAAGTLYSAVDATCLGASTCG